MGETSPGVSPLSVDIAGDKDYRVYRYDWVFGVALPNLSGTNRGELWWDWQKRLADATSVSVQMILSPAAGMGYTCVAAQLNVLPPSRDTKTWWQKNRGDVYEVVKAGTRTAEEIYPGTITKEWRPSPIRSMRKPNGAPPTGSSTSSSTAPPRRAPSNGGSRKRS